MLRFFTNKDCNINKQLNLPSCTTCGSFSEYQTQDKLNPDKTVTKGKTLYSYCQKGKFVLKDVLPCELYQIRKAGQIMLPAPPLPESEWAGDYK